MFLDVVFLQGLGRWTRGAGCCRFVGLLVCTHRISWSTSDRSPTACVETEGISATKGRQEQVRGVGQSEEVGASLYMSSHFVGVFLLICSVSWPACYELVVARYVLRGLWLIRVGLPDLLSNLERQFTVDILPNVVLFVAILMNAIALVVVQITGQPTFR